MSVKHGVFQISYEPFIHLTYFILGWSSNKLYACGVLFVSSTNILFVSYWYPFGADSEEYLESSRRSTMDVFCETSFNYCRKKALSKMFAWVLNTPLKVDLEKAI